jgi:hypothetical protein
MECKQIKFLTQSLNPFLQHTKTGFQFLLFLNLKAASASMLKSGGMSCSGYIAWIEFGYAEFESEHIHTSLLH